MPAVAITTQANEVSLRQLSGEVWRRGGDEPRPGLWPSSRPGSKEWTVSVISAKTRLEHFGPSGVTEVPGSASDPPVLIAPRLAHYALWSPDGSTLCYVSPDGHGLSLRTWRHGDPGVKTHVSAAPVFPAWVPGSNWLLCHHGATLSAFETVTGEQRVLSTVASGFRTPAVSTDGRRIAWAEVADGRVRVMHGEFLGEPGVAGRFASGVALGFRPGTHELIAAVAAAPDSGVFGEVLRLAAHEPARLLKGPLVAFWWAPDGERFASLHPTFSGDGRFQTRVYDAGGRFAAAMEPFIPSADTATAVGFFDQYGLSHSCWSDDSRWFGICGRVLTEGPHPSFFGGPGDAAWVWDTSGRGLPERLDNGTMISFSRA